MDSYQVYSFQYPVSQSSCYTVSFIETFITALLRETKIGFGLGILADLLLCKTYAKN